LSPFLCIGTIFAFFQFEESSPWWSDELKINVSIRAISWQANQTDRVPLELSGMLE